MIRVIIDDDMHSADVDLINDFSTALIDRDKYLMSEVVYLAWERVDANCRCFEVNCICERK
tara:strand:- start:556 stop:738 length:183 start_codon:yes stop_codon:yes gene_type:complete